jgi:hypothetical protein
MTFDRAYANQRREKSTLQCQLSTLFLFLSNKRTKPRKRIEIMIVDFTMLVQRIRQEKDMEHCLRLATAQITL